MASVRRMLRAVLVLMAVAVAASAVPGAARAEFPERPITLYLGFAAGGSSDITARQFVPYLEKYLPRGTSVIVENQPGADGANMLRELAKAPADGYSLGLLTSPNTIAVLHEGKDVRYTLDSFDYLGQLISEYGTLTVAKDGQFGSFEELIEWAKANPGDLSVGVTGFSGIYVGLRELFQLAGVEVIFVPYNSGGDLSTALLGGHIHASGVNLTSALNFKDTQKVILVLADKPVEGVEAPNARDLGHDVVINTTRGIIAPAGLPDDAKTVLEDAIRKAATDPEYEAKLRSMALTPGHLGSAEYRAYLQSVHDHFGEIWARDPWVQN
ncbi:tripartite tricarboxylate transporter substrate binding protein [Pseudochelatococcus sp. B33]